MIISVLEYTMVLVLGAACEVFPQQMFVLLTNITAPMVKTQLNYTVWKEECNLHRGGYSSNEHSVSLSDPSLHAIPEVVPTPANISVYLWGLRRTGTQTQGSPDKMK